MTNAPSSTFARIDGVHVHYVTAGSGEVALLIHGWPTSSHLWRHVIPTIATGFRVIAPDLPGFGRSGKPRDRRYDLESHARVIDGILEREGASRVNLVVHDLGGPIGLAWAMSNPSRISRLVLLNTLVYPQLSWAARMFVLSVRIPLIRRYLSSSQGIAAALRVGVAKKGCMRRAVIEEYQAPFTGTDARSVLLQAVRDIDTSYLRTICERLRSFEGPVRIIYGAQDRILPDIASTVRRLQVDLPQATVTELAGCGHFIQEECPEKIAQLLVEFLAETT